MKNIKISIVIPTYNRADILNYCLDKNINIVRRHSIEIIISDNASTDATETVVNKWINTYPYIKYYKHETNLGPDLNFEYALKQSSTDYVWLLGDSYLISELSIHNILAKITNECVCDLFLLNPNNFVKNIASTIYTDKNLFLREMFWVTNCMSSLIYNKNLIDNADFSRYRNTYFIQTGIIYEYISNRKFCISWNEDISVKLWDASNGIKKNGWQDSNLFEIWLKSRTNVILSLPPSYDIDVKLKLIKEVHIFEKIKLRTLLAYRMNKAINQKICLGNKTLLKTIIELPYFIVLMVSVLPIKALNILIIIKKQVQSILRLH